MLKSEHGWRVNITAHFWIIGFDIMSNGILASNLVRTNEPAKHKLNSC